ncbi:MAG: acyl-phosphate glycerol 3-phosphate acyltransferase [Acidobacteriales bacterium 13_2_20CM_55_8]|nr:MAG: acyl-phosphate glycerol 3-phosphate acyltransferase [Acidobacteriales bacterium 13_2_20CM_55_8]
MLPFFLTAAFSYLLGSVPFGYILLRIFRGQDVRQTGSGNIGATNVARSSPALGVLTLFLDALKGAIAVAVARALFPDQMMLAAIAALFAILGHIFPVWLRFRGGKGVATGLGAFVMLAPKIVLIALGIFVVMVFAFRYVSLASIVTVALFPLLAWLLKAYGNTPMVLVFMAAASALIIAKHRGNIRRLFAGTEPHFQWRRG